MNSVEGDSLYKNAVLVNVVISTLSDSTINLLAQVKHQMFK